MAVGEGCSVLLISGWFCLENTLATTWIEFPDAGNLNTHAFMIVKGKLDLEIEPISINTGEFLIFWLLVDQTCLVNLCSRDNHFIQQIHACQMSLFACLYNNV